MYLLMLYIFLYNKTDRKKLAAYVILAVSLTGHKEVLSIHIGENESAKYWLGVLNELKNRGVKDVLVICADGLSGMKGAPYQRHSRRQNYSVVSFIRCEIC